MLKSLNLPANIQLSRTETVSSVEAPQKAFEENKKLGHEGPVVKDPGSPYWPGRRGKYWIKLKKEPETLGFVVVAAEFGHGKRAGTISDYTLAVRDNEEFRVGKAYSGLSNEEINYMTDRVRSLLVLDSGYRMVIRPEIISHFWRHSEKR